MTSLATPPTTATTNEHAEPGPRQHVAATVAVAVLGVFVTYMPINGVSGALTTIASATDASTAQLQWISDAYVIPMAAAVLSGGVFGDLYGRRRIFSLGLGLTALGGLIAALAAVLGSAALPTLLGGQAVSGLGAGLLLPTTLALITHAVPDPRARARYIGLWAGGVSAGLALGPLLSGAVLEFAGWGWIFVPTAVLALGTLVYGHLRLPESKNPEGRRLDWPGQITAALAIAALIFGVIEGGAQGWSSTYAMTGLTVGILALAAFIVVERRAPAPLMDLRIFTTPGFGVAAFASLIALFSIVGITFLLSLYLGSVHGFSALEIGIRLFFMAGLSAVCNPLIGRLMGRIQPLLLLTTGLALAALAALLIAQTGPTTSFLDLIWRLAVFGVSVALMLTSVTVVSVNAVPWNLAGMAAASSTALRQFGGALGPAILGAIYTSCLADGHTPTTALHTALITTSILLAIGVLGCLAVLAATRRHPSHHSGMSHARGQRISRPPSKDASARQTVLS
ncbi:MFS transporter [Streptomyces sp. 061-3]|uniref:MFS transporter n=1 Tax=Streptomyces sp. 061-3 TaxID=2789268 RepID=UPI00397F941E